MKKKILAVIFVTILPITIAHAEGLYAGINYTKLNVDTGYNTTVHPSVATVNVGNLFSPNFALEGRLGTSISSDSTVISGTSIDVKFNNIYGIYGKGLFPVTDSVSLYGLVGYTHAEPKATSKFYSGTDSNGSGSYGFGVTVEATKDVSFNLEYTKLASDTTGISFGATFKF